MEAKNRNILFQNCDCWFFYFLGVAYMNHASFPVASQKCVCVCAALQETGMNPNVILKDLTERGWWESLCNKLLVFTKSCGQKGLGDLEK